MGESVEKALKVEASCPKLEAYLLMLEAVGMPLHQILPLAEQEGMPVPAMVEWADGFLQRVAYVDEPADAVVLVFGCVRHWESLLPLVERQGAALLQALLMGRPGRLESLASLRDRDFFATFRSRVLHRLGYPICLAQSQRLKVRAPKHLKDVMSWLGSGRSVLAYELDLQGFQSTSTSWGTLHAPLLGLRNGTSPEKIEWRPDPTDPIFWNRQAALHIQQVAGLRYLGGTTYGDVTLETCPDLEELDGPCATLKAEDCPRLKGAWVGTHSHGLSLKRCEALEAIQPWSMEYPENPSFGSEWIFELEAIEVIDCPRLRCLPRRLHIKDRLHFQGVGHLEDWPWDFQVGGNFLVSDCPGMEALPTVEVQGSLIVTGASGLRRLSPGTIIGKNLDLRACARFEDFPRGVQVGGNIYLPAHLNHRRKPHANDRMEACEMLETPQPDLYEELRTLLKVLRFPILIPSPDLVAHRELAEQSLGLFRVRLAQEPRFEAILLWTASEVWRELAEEAWAASNPLAYGPNESDEDMPMAWFLERIRE